jgi:heat shock protein HtpX
MVGDELRSAVRSNAIRTAVLVAGFPFVLPSVLFVSFLAVLTVFGHLDAFSVASKTFVVSAMVMVVITLAWLPIGYLINQWVIDKATGARLLSRSENRRLWEIFERLCTTAGMRLPALRIIDTDSLNAFASGLREGQYSVAVTRGLLNTLTDDEMEAVLGHELTHIRNHDVRLLVVAIVLVGLVPMVHDVVMKVYWAVIMGILNLYRAIMTVMPFGKLIVEVTYGGVYWAGKLIAYAIGLVSTMASLLIHFAISRQREFMADAGAADLTGKPEAMIAALRRISGNSTLETTLEGVRAMCFDNAAVGLGGWFATHPPIDERIEALQRLIASPAEQRSQPRPAPTASLHTDEPRSSPPQEEPSRREPDPSTVARYRLLILGGHPELLKFEGRQELYRRLRGAVEQARQRNPAISEVEAAQAALCLDLAIEEIELDIIRRGR